MGADTSGAHARSCAKRGLTSVALQDDFSLAQCQALALQSIGKDMKKKQRQALLTKLEQR